MVQLNVVHQDAVKASAHKGNNMLSDDLKVLQATSFSYYIKAAGFHWNVEGKNFPEYHKFLRKLYEDIYDTIDVIAEYIRSLDSYTPGSLTRYMELTQIQDQLKIPRAELMFAELLADTQVLLGVIMSCFTTATAENQQGIANFLSERQAAMQKHAWMIRSILKQDRG
jgi:starvation-inducible DNA-binding protein